MREKMRAYAGTIALVGVVLLLVALGAWAVQGTLATWASIVLGVGVVAGAVSIVLEPAPVVRALTGRRARYGSNAVVMSLAFVVIIAVVNYVGSRYHWRWDVTASQAYSLSEQTKGIVRGLDEPVTIRAFFTPTHYNRVNAEDILEEYAALSPNVRYEILDPELDRQAAIEAGVGRDGTVVLTKGDRVEYAFGVDEQDLTSAFLKLTQERQRGVYFVTGHGERSPTDFEEQGYGAVGQALEAENYVVDTVNLATVEAIPEAADVIVVAAPQTAYRASEVELLTGFLEAGGGLLVLVEPGATDPFDGALEAYGVALPDALVMDRAQAFYGDAATPLVDTYGFHQITKDIAGYTSLFPGARPLAQTAEQPEGWLYTQLVATSQQAVGERDYRGTGEVQEGEPLEGALALAAAVERSSTEGGTGRLVVFGDATFAENSILSQVMGVANADLILNSVGWLAEDESLISIRPTEPEDRSIALSGVMMNLVLLISAVLMPATVALAGISVWWRRR
jgi:ABC-type uncharacterized transport system involved in gliding motility auxiliary subunit